MSSHVDEAEFNASVKTLTQLNVACPMEYEGELEDGRVFRFSYRWGFASLSLGSPEHPDPRLDPKPTILAYGQDQDGWLGMSDFRHVFLRLLKRSQESVSEKGA